MIMTPEEIVRDFKESKVKKKQIQILADLNNCKNDEIIQILRDAGVKLQGVTLNDSKAESTELSADAAAETKPGELNDLEKSMAEIITELRGENDALKGTVQELTDKIAGYEIVEQDLCIKLQEAQDRVKQLEDELADARAALESTERQLADELETVRAYSEHVKKLESELGAAIEKDLNHKQAMTAQIESQMKVIESLTSAISDQGTRSEQERRRSSEIMMRLIEKFVLTE